MVGNDDDSGVSGVVLRNSAGGDDCDGFVAELIHSEIEPPTAESMSELFAV